jgi:hypothetical protein
LTSRPPAWIRSHPEPHGIIPASQGLAIGGAILLLLFNGLGWRITSAAFQRERLISGIR